MRLSKRRLSFQNLESRRLLAAVDIPDSLTGAPAQVVSAPVNVDSATGIRGVEIRLSYNTAVLDLDQASVTAGTVWNGATDTQVIANVDDATGTVVVFISSSSALGNVSGSLVQLGFTVAAGASVGTTANLNLTEVTLNEGQISVTPAPVAGVDSTDGLITVISGTGSDRISGFVFADANSNSTLDATEGIGGVTITLVNQSTQTTVQATTLADGSYEFTSLAPGTYSIRQQQPTAYLDGGTNELSVTLVTGTAQTNQNFRELGLRPTFLYNRLLTTLVMPVASTPWTNLIAKINSDAASGTVAPASTASSTQLAAAQLETASESPSSAGVQSELALAAPLALSAIMPQADSSIVASSTCIPRETSLEELVQSNLVDNKKSPSVDDVDSVMSDTTLW